MDHCRHLTSPRSTERLLQSVGDQHTHARPSDSESEISRAQRALDEANATLHRREERRRHDGERRRREGQTLDQARAAAREAFRAGERARQAIALSATSAEARAIPYPARQLGVAYQEARPGNDAFMSGNLQYMATTMKVEFSAHRAEAVVAAATVLLTSERQSSFRAEDLSVGAVWARCDNTSAFGQMMRAPTLALIKVLILAHDDAPDLRLAHDDAPDPVLWSTPKEELEERSATKQRRGCSRDRGDRNRGGGSSGGGGGQTGGNEQNGGDGGHHNRRVGNNGGRSAGGTSGTGGGPQRLQGGNQVRTNRSGGRSSGAGTGGRRNSARGPSAWDRSSTSSRSSSRSNTDHGKVTVVAGKRQVTPSLVGIASSAKLLSKLTVSGDRTKPFSSDLARERTAKLATAGALAKSTLDVSAMRAYVKLSYKDASSICVLPFPASLNKSDGTRQLTPSVWSAITDYACAATTVAKRAYVSTRGYPVGSTPSESHSTVP